MEKRLFTAIFLSLIVLLVYDSVFVSPHRKALDKSQVVVNKEVTELPKILPARVKDIVPPTESNFPVKIVSLSTPQTTLDLTNRGGSVDAIHFANYEQYFPVRAIATITSNANEEYTVKSADNNKITYSFTKDFLSFVNMYKKIDDYTFSVNIELSNLSNMSKVINSNVLAFEVSNRLDNVHQNEKMLYEYSVYLDKKVYRKGNAFNFSGKDVKVETKAPQWLGFRNRYFCTIVKPEFPVKNYEIKPLDDKVLYFNVTPQETKLGPGEKVNYVFTVYAGPQDLLKLASYKKDFDKIMVFSNWGWLDAVAKAIYYTLLGVHKVMPNWGLCIILVGFLVYGLMYPLTLQSMSSMRKIQEIQPKINELREKYKDNPQKLNTETMEIYKKYQINPLGGCLPLFFQMPVFYGLYQVLWRSYFFKGAGFLWIKDLSEPDRLFLLPFQLPFLGNEVNLLPVIMMIVMALQQKFTSKNITITDAAQATQQKMMAIMMPVFIGFIFYHFASGLTLYFTLFYTLSMITQWKMSKITVRVL